MHKTNRDITDYLAQAQRFLDARRAKHLDFRMEADGANENEPPSEQEQQAPAPPKPSDVPRQNGPNGYPENTPVSKMTPEQREAYDADKKRRNQVWRDATGGRTPDELKADLDELADLRRSLETEVEQQIREAREDERAKTVAEMNNSVSTMMLRSTLSLRGKEPEQIDQILSTTNLDAFVIDGEVDEQKLSAYADLIAGPVMGGGATWSGTGQGSTPRGGKPSGLQAGRDAYRAQRKTTSQ